MDRKKIKVIPRNEVVTPSLNALRYMQDSAIRENIERLHRNGLLAVAKRFVEGMEYEADNYHGAGVDMTIQFEIGVKDFELQRRRQMNALFLLVEAGVMPF
jgi:hypothetical protein